MKARGGFTLVELLVVIALIAMLATLAITFLPNAASAQRESRAAVQVQSWLSIAKQRALRDQAPRGVRFWITSAAIGPHVYANACTDAQYLEQPDDFAGGTVMSGMPMPAPSQAWGYTLNNCLMFMNIDPVNGFSASTVIPNSSDPHTPLWPIQPGDFIEFFGTGLMHEIVQIGVPSGSAPPNPAVGNPAYVVINPPLTYPIAPTASYRIVRAPRPVGDETLKLPDNTMIDFATNTAFNNPLPPQDPNSGSGGFVDIMFSPSGAVISRNVTVDKIHLWVRAPNADDGATPPGSNPFRGDPTLVSIFVRTGFVGAFPPDPTPGNSPYDLVK